MKELTIEEKAKCYDEAIERAKKIHKYSSDLAEIKRIEQIFPELKESENERISKEIIDIIDSYDVAHLRAAGLPSRIPKYIAWLEKQGEQKPVDNVESKHIRELDNSYARVKFPFKAKVKSTGIVVTIHSGQLSEHEWIKYQSDKEDGYKVYKPGDLELVCDVEPNPAWSEEDEKLVKNLISTLSNLYARNLIEKETKEKYTNWLKSLKPQKQWKPTEEHIKVLDLCTRINPATGELSREPSIGDITTLRDLLERLKQL